MGAKNTAQPAVPIWPDFAQVAVTLPESKFSPRPGANPFWNLSITPSAVLSNFM